MTNFSGMHADKIKEQILTQIHKTEQEVTEKPFSALKVSDQTSARLQQDTNGQPKNYLRNQVRKG